MKGVQPFESAPEPIGTAGLFAPELGSVLSLRVKSPWSSMYITSVPKYPAVALFVSTRMTLTYFEGILSNLNHVVWSSAHTGMGDNWQDMQVSSQHPIQVTCTNLWLGICFKICSGCMSVMCDQVWLNCILTICEYVVSSGWKGSITPIVTKRPAISSDLIQVRKCL